MILSSMPVKEESIERVVDEPDISVLLPLSIRIHRESTEKKRFVAFPAPYNSKKGFSWGTNWQKVDYSWTATNVLFRKEILSWEENKKDNQAEITSMEGLTWTLTLNKERVHLGRVNQESKML